MKRALAVLLILSLATLVSAPGAEAAPLGQQGGGAGVFQTALDRILDLARQAWVFLTTLILVVAMLGGLYYALQGTAGAAFGGSRLASAAIVGVVGLILLALVVFLVLPSLGDVLRNNMPNPPF